MRAEVEDGRRSRPSSMLGPPGRATVDSPSPEHEDSQAEWARQEQELMIRQQDETIDTIAGTLNTIHEQAGLMGREIQEHNECVLRLLRQRLHAHSINIHFRMLEDVERGVDRSDAKLSSAMSRMRKFIRQTEGT